MPESIKVWLDDQIGLTGQYLWLRKSDGTLLNTGGDTLAESPAGSGQFVATLAESRTGLGTLRATITGSSDPADTLAGLWLAEGSTVCVDDYPQAAGGGAGDAEQATLLEVKATVNLINSNTSSLSNLTASLPIKPGVIIGPSEPLVIGDDYTSTVGRQMRVNLLNSTGGSATTTFGSKSLSDAGTSIQLLLRKSGQVSAAAQLVGTCSFFPAETVDGVEIPPYLLVSFSRTETAKATPGAYDMQAEAVWESGEVVTFAPYGQVEFVRNILRVG